MKIAIISDVHNNLVNLKKVLDYCAGNKIKNIICCGDLAASETLDFINDNFFGEIRFVFGNMDIGYLENFKFIDRYKNTFLYKKFGEWKKYGKNVAFTHFPEMAKELCFTGKYDFVFYGHTHKPCEEKNGRCKMLNPGNLAGEYYLPTFAVWDTRSDEFQLIRVHSL